MNGLEILTTATGALALTWGSTYVIQNIYDRAYERWHKVRWDHMNYQAQLQANELAKIRVIEPDATGRAGIAFDGQVYRNLDTLAVYEQAINRYINPVLEQLERQHRLLQAIASMSGGAAAQAALDAGSAGAIPTIWPDVVHLPDLFHDRQPSIDDLVIGVHPNGQGLETVSLSLHDLMHTLVVGASGWGKSTWLRAFLWQIAHAREPVDVCAIDISGTEFNPLREWDKLRYPVARNIGDAVAILGAIAGEIGRRRALYEHNAPLAGNVVEYNAATGADLPPWVICVDEGTSLLNQGAIGDPIRDAVQTARQYGVYVLLAGQSAKHNVVDTQVRDNFSSRLCCRTSPTSSRVVLDDRAASDLTVKGRMWVQLVGQQLQELQGPYCTREQFASALTTGGPRHPTPERDPGATSAQDLGLSADQVERIIDLWTSGETYSAVADQVFEGGRNGRRVNLVRAVIESNWK